MTYSLNRAQLIGNLTRDPESRQTAGGQMVTTFTVATNSVWVDKNGQKQEKSEFHPVVVWGKLAEFCGQYLSKGRKVFVEGRMQTREWEGEDGVKRNKTEIVASNIIFLDKSGAPVGGAPSFDQGTEHMDEAPEESRPSPVTKVKRPSSAVAEEAPMSLDDLPF